MDYNNKPLTIELVGIENNTFYDKTFCNNNNYNMNKIPKMNSNNKLNIHHLDLTKNITLRYNNPLTPVLIYFKVPKEEYDTNNLTFESDKELYYTSGIISENGLYKIIK